MSNLLRGSTEIRIHIFFLVSISGGPRHTPNPSTLTLQTPQKKPFLGGFYIIKYFFNFGDTTMIQNMKNIKRSFGSIFDILVNTWSTPADLEANKIRGFWKKFVKNVLFPIFKVLSIKIWKFFQQVMCSEKFPRVLKNDFKVLIKCLRKCQQFFTSTFLMTKYPKSRRIWGMSRAVIDTLMT